MKAAIYVRVSTLEQAEEGFSISAQIKLLKEYCAKNDIEIVNVYADEGISGTKENRPQFQQMIKDAEKKMFNIILVHRYDRFARKVELSQRVKRQLRKVGINIVSITEPVEDSPIGFFQEGIMELLAEYYSKNLSQEVKKGHKERASQGFHSGSIPYGYKRDPLNPTIMQINEEQALIIRYIFELYTKNNYGLVKISKTLNESGIAGAIGGSWCPRSVKMALNNHKYIGMIRLGTNIYKGMHEPIIDNDTWEVAQKLQQNAKEHNTYIGNNYNKFLLMGMCKCGVCGGAIITRKSNKHFYYCCSTNRRAYDKACVSTLTIRTEKLEEHINTKLEYIFSSTEINFDVVKKNTVEDVIMDRNKKLTQKLDRLKAGYLEGIFDLAEYKSKKEEIEKEIEESKIAFSTIDKKEIKEKARNYWEQYKQVETINEKRELLKKFISHIMISKEYIDIFFYAN